ncbi:MAG: N-6 DNA methylase [Chloroflexota bacterium]
MTREPDDLVVVADALAAKIRAIGATAVTEEDLRVRLEGELRPITEAFDLRVTPRYEEGVPKGALAAGRADAIYGGVYIEYKRPGRLESTPTRDDAIRQVQDYLEGAVRSDDDERARARLVGVLTDGRRIIFVRHRGPRSSALDYYHRTGGTTRPESPWHVSEPLLITRESVGQLLVYLRALDREPLTAEGLAAAFGPRSEIGPQLVQALYRRLATSDAPIVDTLYREWDRIFGIVYGQDQARAARGAEDLGALYGVAHPDLKRLFFAVHTYYAFVMKILAVEVASLQQGTYIRSFTDEVAGLDDASFDRRLRELEDGSEFRRLEITNFLEGDFFGWYLAVWDGEMRELVRSFVTTLERFEPTTATVRPDLARDILKHLYQYLVPKRLRHDLGEYYTPDWLAEFLLDEAGYTGDPAQRVLDPACGSGTFLALEIGRVIAYANEHMLDERDVAKQLVRNVVGFDINPLAVLAARTTYLLSLGHLLRYVRPLEIPVYLCDSVLLPRPHGGGLFDRGWELPTSAGVFVIPGAIDRAAKMSRFAEALERAVEERHEPAGLLRTVERQVGTLDDGDRDLLNGLYDKICGLANQGRDGIWPRIIRNSFAPVFVSEARFDFVIGNPPWVNWESLSDEYRRATLGLWQDYGLFSLKGHAARLGGGKKDLSMLMLYAAAHEYLQPGGTLAFLVTQTLFKSAGAGAGFRRFRLGHGVPLGVRAVHDMSSLQPFEGASNRTAAVVIERDAETSYPVRWVEWATAGHARPETDAALPDVLRSTTRVEMVASPVGRGDPTSPWLTALESQAGGIADAVGPSDYRAYAGSFTGGLNGAYWLEVLATRTDGTVLIRNLATVGKIKVEQVETTIEPDLVYPLLRGRDVAPWRATPSASILLVQDPDTRTGIPEGTLAGLNPLTYAYLERFEDQLRDRAAFRKYFGGSDPFYSMYNIGPYTVSRWKVVWREQAAAMTAAVIGQHEGRTIIPDHKLMLVPVGSEDEAHFLCAALNSPTSAAIVAAYALAIGFSTHVLEHVPVPRFDPTMGPHLELAALGRAAAATGAVDEDALDRAARMVLVRTPRTSTPT